MTGRRNATGWIGCAHGRRIRHILISGALVLMAGCLSVPLDLPKARTTAITDNTDTEFGQLAQGWAVINGDASGFYPLVNGIDALGARLEMVARAEATIDLQYFLMKGDTSGALLADALWKAAERGVRVRFLLDDVFTSAPDSGLHALDSHPNIEVRLFNPISRRGFHTLNFLGHFRRANRRMHNKSFTVDNAIGIVGGRNIADEYFALRDDAVFADFDVLAFGPVIRDVSASFDAYWNHELAVPIDQLLSEREKAEARKQLGNWQRPPELLAIYHRARDAALVRQLASGDTKMYVAKARVISDDPDKLERRVSKDNRPLITDLGQLLVAAEDELVFITPYYVPGKDGLQFVRDRVDSGVRVRVLTNSLASNNHIPVHSAYASYRRRVLDAGVELYEARADAGKTTAGPDAPSALTMHTKLIIIDRRYVFVGSLNLDPRSIDINAEMGLLIDAPELATRIVDGLDAALPEASYRIVARDGRFMEWHTEIDGETVVENNEPLSSRWRRFKAWVLRIAPESQL
ncbi:MAG: phospholipase D family protein [Pseudomonadota bacterium]